MKKNGSPELHLRFHILSMTFKKSDKNHQNLGGGGHKYFKNVLGLQKLFTISSNWYFGVLHLAMSQFYGGNGSASAFHSRYGFLVILMVTQLDSLIKMDYQCKWEFRIDSLMQISHSAMIQRAIMKNTK